MTETPSTVRPPALFLLIVLVTVSQIGVAIYTPSIPAMAVAFRTDFMTIQLTMTVFLVGFAFSQLFVGGLSDRYGRRPIMLWGVGLFTASSFAAALAPSIELLLAARLVQSAGASVGMVLGRAIVRDCYGPAERMKRMAYIGMAAGLTPALSPSLGGLLQVWFGWRANFFAMAIIALCGLALAVLLLRETLPEEERGDGGIGDMRRAFGTLLGDSRFLSYASVNALSTATFFVFITGGPIVLIGFNGITPDVYGLYALAMPSGFVLGNLLSSRISGRLGMDRAINLGNGFSTLFMIVMLGIVLAGYQNGAVFFIPIHLMGWANGLIVPNGFAGAVAGDPPIAGAASGLSGFLQMAAGAAATLLVGFVVPNSFTEFTALMAILTGLGWASFVLLLRAARRRRPESNR